MLTVKRYGRGPGAAYLGKPALHPATVDLKGKSYEYVTPLLFCWLINVESETPLEVLYTLFFLRKRKQRSFFFPTYFLHVFRYFRLSI